MQTAVMLVYPYRQEARKTRRYFPPSLLRLQESGATFWIGGDFIVTLHICEQHEMFLCTNTATSEEYQIQPGCRIRFRVIGIVALVKPMSKECLSSNRMLWQTYHVFLVCNPCPWSCAKLV